jgi:hypothetical protein
MALVMLPGWQTEELKEEWVDYEEDEDASGACWVPESMHRLTRRGSTQRVTDAETAKTSRWI